MDHRKDFAIKVVLSVWGVSTLAFMLLASTIGKSRVIESFAFLDTFQAFGYQLLTLFCLVFGILWANPNFFKKMPKLPGSWAGYAGAATNEQRSFTMNPLLVYVCCALILISALAVYSQSGFAGDLEAQRTQQIEATQDVGLISYAAQFSQALAIALSAIIPWLKKINRVTKLILLGSLLVSCTLFTIATAGRIAVFACFILPLILSLSIQNYRFLFLNRKLSYKIYILSSFLLLAFLLALGFSAFQFFRSSSYIEIVFGPAILPYREFLWSLGIDGDLNLMLSSSVFLILEYISSGIQYFPQFFEIYQPHPLLGAYQFNFISSRLPDYDWFAWKDEVEASYRYFGLYWNVWASYVRDYIVDFGKIGTPLFSLVTGLLIGFVELRSTQNAKIFTLYIILLSWLVMSPYYSLFIFRPFHIAFLFTLTWALIDMISPEKKKVRRIVYHD
jgi:hypothetical protein